LGLWGCIFVKMSRVTRLSQHSWGYGVWGWWFLLGSACAPEDELKPAYRLEGKVVTAGTDWPVGVPVHLGVCYRNDAECVNPLVAWTTDSAGNFDQLFRTEDDPDRLRMVVISNPARHFEPISMPSLTSRTMTSLRVELPAVGWLRMQLNLNNMGQGGSTMVQVGSSVEFYYQPELVHRVIPWNSMMPLQVQVTYRPSTASSPMVSSHDLMVPPLDTTSWSWTP
jgi:hypothetical protein